jgi:hypothetical protein
MEHRIWRMLPAVLRRDPLAFPVSGRSRNLLMSNSLRQFALARPPAKD